MNAEDEERDPSTAPARVLLLRHAPTPATRAHTFPADEALDAEGAALAARLAAALPAADDLTHDLAHERVVSSPARRCLQTAAGAGLAVDATDPRLAELDFGAWTGRAMEEVWDAERDVMSRWMADPRVPTPDGEGWDDLATRVTAALDDLREPGRTTLVVTHGGVVRCAVATVLGAPPEAAWRLDVAPCSLTVLRTGPTGDWLLEASNRRLV
ncbi:MAG: histidine phosphatase family protein [Actinomycetes bacterium]